MEFPGHGRAALLALCALLPGVGCGLIYRPELKTIHVADPAQLPAAPLPDAPPPRTVDDPQPDGPTHPITLDEAIRANLANTRVVRVLAGVAAVASGQTIYDPAISHTIIDQEQAAFDPKIDFNNTWERNETPQAVLDPAEPDGTRIDGLRRDSYRNSTQLSKKIETGGTASLQFNDTLDRFQPGVFPLNPQNQHSLDLSLTQPLLQGGGRRVNLAPIVIAQINTERSYFQYKDSVQESVRGVIEAYWALVFARTDLWTRQQQVQQGKFAYERAEARLRSGVRGASVAEVAQTRLAFANFQANLVSAQANAIQREAALKNLLGLPPTGPLLIPMSSPVTDRIEVRWDEIIALAEQRRPDIIELKLVIAADEQRILQARNNALPRADAVAVYGWNGMEGKTVIRTTESTSGGEFTDWTLGVNFSVPLGLRQGRAALRQQELILARDRANLEQGVHAAVHSLATSTRSLAQFHAQYLAFREARVAARANLEQQAADFRAGRAIFLNVLQAITDWGNAVSSEAQALTQYNTELANLERQTGTILESHAVQFFEERYASIGPLGRIAKPHCYPHSLPPGPNADRYPTMPEPAENFFDLKTPAKKQTAPDARDEYLPLPPKP